MEPLEPEINAPEIEEAPSKQEDGKKENYQPIEVQERSIFSNPNGLEFEILNRLEDKSRLFQQKQVKERNPTYLVTLDQFRNEGTAQALQNAVLKLTDYHNKGKNRVAFLYPFILEENAKVKVKLALIHPPLFRSKRDCRPFIESCIQHSKPYFDKILKHRKHKPLDLSEESPGAALMVKRKDGKTSFMPRQLSLENEIRQLLHKAFHDLGLQVMPVFDFLERFVEYAVKNNLVKAIRPNYHVIIDELAIDNDGNYNRAPELVQHYRAQVDALEKYLLPWLVSVAQKNSIADFLEAAENFKTEWGESIPGRNQRKEKANALIEILRKFSIEKVKEESVKNNWAKIQESFAILEQLNILKDDLIIRRNNKNIENLINRLSSKIRNRSGSADVRNITTLDLRQEIKKVKIVDNHDVDKYSQEVYSSLVKEFGYYVHDSESKFEQVSFVDPSYFIAVESHLARQAMDSEEYKSQLETLYKIKKTIDSSELKENLNRDISDTQRSEFAASTQRHTTEKQIQEKKNEFEKKWNISRGLLISLGYLLFGGILAAIFSWWVILATMVSLPILAPIFFKRSSAKKKHSKSIHGSYHNLDDFEDDGAAANSDNESAVKEAEQQLKEKEEKKKNFYTKVTKAVAEKLVPVRYETLAHRAFSAKDLEKNLAGLIDQIPEFKKFKKEPDKILKNIDLALMSNFVKIKIPENLDKAKKANYWYIPMSDWNTSKEAIGDGFRTMMKGETPGSRGYELYKHLVNCVEMYHHPQFKKFIVDRPLR